MEISDKEGRNYSGGLLTSDLWVRMSTFADATWLFFICFVFFFFFGFLSLPLPFPAPAIPSFGRAAALHLFRHLVRRVPAGLLGVEEAFS